MRSSFFEFHVAFSGLHTSRGGLQTVSHNTANAATPGFSRQVANARATTPLQMFNGRGMVGTGSHVFSVTQVRDVFLDRKFWGSMPTLGQYSAKRAQLGVTQTVLAELDGTGLTALFNGFFDSLQDLTENAGDATFRMNILGSADALSTWLKDTHSAFMRQQRDINNEIAAMVQSINSIGYQIRSLNDRIRIIELTGENANDLRDQRTRLVDELSRLVNVDAREEDFGGGDRRFFVQINGQDFVSNLNLRTLRVVPRRVEDERDGMEADVFRNPEDNPGLYDIFWGAGNVRFDIYNRNLSGELRGLIDVRDGNNGNHAVVNPNGFNFDPSDTGNDNLPTLRIPLASLEDTRSRLDLAASPGGGVIRVTDPVTRMSREVHYRSVEFDPDSGEFVFTMVERPPGSTPLEDILRDSSRLEIGRTSEFKGIPYYIDRLNNLVRTFASAINFGTRLDGTGIPDVIGHVNGVDVNGNRGEPPTLFFTYTFVDSAGITQHATFWDEDGEPFFDNHRGADRARNLSIFNIRADNFYVNPELLRNPLLMNSSNPNIENPEGEDQPDHGVSNNLVLLSWLRVNQDNTVFAEGRLLDFIIGMTGELAIDIKQADSFSLNYNNITTHIDVQRMSISGVSINEEMANMIKFQQLFQASSRLINVIDQIYGTLVNNLGVT